jgi:hypothetical protein
MAADKEDTAPKLEVVPQATEVELDADEQEFRALRRDLPGVKGASAVGIVSINVGKTPGRNEFFRTHPEFRPVVPIVDLEIGMERHFFAVTDEMVEALASIGITVTNHTLYLTVTPRGAVRIVPIRHPILREARTSITEQKRSDYSRASTSGCGSTPIRKIECTKFFLRRRAGLRTLSGRS